VLVLLPPNLRVRALRCAVVTTSSCNQRVRSDVLTSIIDVASAAASDLRRLGDAAVVQGKLKEAVDLFSDLISMCVMRCACVIHRAGMNWILLCLCFICLPACLPIRSRAYPQQLLQAVQRVASAAQIRTGAPRP